MKILSLSAALIAASFAFAPVAEARPYMPRGRTVTVTLENGNTLNFRMVMMHGRMMAVTTAEDFANAFHLNPTPYGH